MPTLAVVAILALAAFRLTRLVTTDTITEGVRDRLYRFAWDDDNPVARDGAMWPSVRAPWRTWLYAGLTCDWCLGVWVSTAVYCAFRWGGGVAEAVIVVAAVAGLQGFVAHWTQDES